MTESTDLLRQESHFSFGKNWASYAKLVTEAQLEQAVLGLRRLVGELRGKRFIDIGCGSGIHAVAALRLHASMVVAVDIDPDSVATTRQVLQAAANNSSWRVMQASVFDLANSSVGEFDVVYSWGVLHHTGDMYRAIRCAAAMVRPGGKFVFALYRRTSLCWFWKLEKRWYARASTRMQRFARALYIALFGVLYTLVKRRAFSSYVKDYHLRRGMDFEHDVHDWLGGWPYESVSPDELDSFMQRLGMRQQQRFLARVGSSGILGSGCDEYVYIRS